MKQLNMYQKVGIIGLVLTFVLQVVLSFAVDPYFASILSSFLSSFYPVWVIVLVVGWRKAHPRR